MYHRFIVLSGWIIAPFCLAKTITDRKAVEWISVGSGAPPRLGACAGGGILLRTECLTSASLALFSEGQTL